MRVLALRLLILLALMGQQGCTASPYPWMVPHVTEKVRATIHTIGIEVAEELPRVTVEFPSKGAGSGAGLIAGRWSDNWLAAAGAAGSDLFGSTIGVGMLVMTPVVAWGRRSVWGH